MTHITIILFNPFGRLHPSSLASWSGSTLQAVQDVESCAFTALADRKCALKPAGFDRWSPP